MGALGFGRRGRSPLFVFSQASRKVKGHGGGWAGGVTDQRERERREREKGGNRRERGER